jgi:hypothetical protein
MYDIPYYTTYSVRRFGRLPNVHSAPVSLFYLPVLALTALSDILRRHLACGGLNGCHFASVAHSAPLTPQNSTNSRHVKDKSDTRRLPLEALFGSIDLE